MTMRRVFEAGFVLLPVVGLSLAWHGKADPNTTAADFSTPGTQPLEFAEGFETARVCSFCHGNYDAAVEPFRNWNGSMMAQAARDPVFRAAVAIANQDVPEIGLACFRCHSPGGWVNGHVTADGSQLDEYDMEGISCIMCHRMVDPVYRPGVSPAVDEGILAGMQAPVVSVHNSAIAWDPMDRRRGPFQILPQAEYHPWLQSPYHRSSALCASCHEVSNPIYSKQANGTYALNALNQPHPTQDKFDMFPEQRTYSEWAASSFAQGPINMGGRFGGNNPMVSTCQDCHLPDGSGTACQPFLGGANRTDLPVHQFAGSNTWVLRAVDKLNSRDETMLDDDIVNASIARNEQMLAKAADLELAADASGLVARVTNQTGHKLPTGYPEGRRMWLNVKFYGASGNLLAERGAYDLATATLTENNTKVYEGEIGIDAAMAAVSGKPQGPGFHLALNNVWYKDNRIPPRGFTNAGFAAVQAAPVAYSYADGQYWDDTSFAIPAGARRAEVTLYYQTTTKPYMDFLRSENTTNSAGNKVYNEYVRFGMSPPVVMAAAHLTLCAADFTGDGFVDGFDYDAYVEAFENGNIAADMDGDGFIDGFDYDSFVAAFELGC